MEVLLALDSTHLHLVILGAMLVVGVLMGSVMAHTDYCAFGAMADWINFGDRGRLGAWLWAIATAVIGTSLLISAGILNIDESIIPYASSTFNPLRMAVGGLLFGIGMHLAGGCTSKNLVRVGGGNVKSLVVLLVAAIPSYLLIRTTLYDEVFYPLFAPLSVGLDDFGLANQTLAAFINGSARASLIVSMALGFIVSVYSLIVVRRSVRRGALLGGTVVGLAVVGGWWVSSGPLGRRWLENASFEWDPPPGIGVQSLTFVRPLADAASVTIDSERGQWVTFALVAALGVMVGSFIYHLLRRRVRLELFASTADFVRNIVGGLLLGLGGVLALGCTIGQGVTGISTLAAGSIIATVATGLGAAVALKVEYYRLVYAKDAGLPAIVAAALADLRLYPRRWSRLEKA